MLNVYNELDTLKIIWFLFIKQKVPDTEPFSLDALSNLITQVLNNSET